VHPDEFENDYFQQDGAAVHTIETVCVFADCCMTILKVFQNKR
jgi:hypothetical protein